MTTEMTAIAFAGVGNPLKDVVWVVSILNFASRSAAQTGISTGTYFKMPAIPSDSIVS